MNNPTEIFHEYTLSQVNILFDLSVPKQSDQHAECFQKVLSHLKGIYKAAPQYFPAQHIERINRYKARHRVRKAIQEDEKTPFLAALELVEKTDYETVFHQYTCPEDVLSVVADQNYKNRQKQIGENAVPRECSMDLAQFKSRYPAFKRVFHFTEEANVASIKQHGILSLREIKNKKLADVRFCSSPESRRKDEQSRLDHCVRLCFVADHPMVYKAKKRGDLAKVVYIEIDASILELPDVQVAAGIAFQSGVQLFPLADALGRLDFEVLFECVDLRDPDVGSRRQAARKYEILVPNRIDPKYILEH